MYQIKEILKCNSNRLILRLSDWCRGTTSHQTGPEPHQTGPEPHQIGPEESHQGEQWPNSSHHRINLRDPTLPIRDSLAKPQTTSHPIESSKQISRFKKHRPDQLHTISRHMLRISNSLWWEQSHKCNSTTISKTISNQIIQRKLRSRYMCLMRR